MDILEKIDKREIKMMILGGRQPLHDGNFTYSLHEKIPDAESEIIALARIGQRMRWIPVSEALPEKKQLCGLFFAFGNGLRRVCEVTFTNKSKGFDNGAFPLEWVTYWRPSDNDRPGEDGK